MLNENAPDFRNALREVFKAEPARILLDALTGPVASTIFAAMPKRARWIIYGRLDPSPTTINEPGQLIFAGKRIEGFWLAEWMRKSPARLGTCRRRGTEAIFGWPLVDRRDGSGAAIAGHDTSAAGTRQAERQGVHRAVAVMRQTKCWSRRRLNVVGYGSRNPASSRRVYSAGAWAADGVPPSASCNSRFSRLSSSTFGVTKRPSKR